MVDLPIIEDRCGTCHFWDHDRQIEHEEDHPRYKGRSYSWCRRYPPVVSPDNAHVWGGERDDEYDCFEQPQTQETNWCGEYRRLALQGPTRIAHATIGLSSAVHEKLAAAGIGEITLAALCAMPRTELAAVAGLDEDELTEVCEGLGYLGLGLAAVSTSAGVADVALASLELPAPVYRRLQNHGLHTVADLVNLTPAQVSAIRWVGAKTLTGIRATLQRHGLRLRGDSTEAENPDG